MRLQWMNHTGLVVEDMDRSLAFYRDLMGLQVEGDWVLDGEWISQVVGYSRARLRIVYLGLGDLRHSVELIQYLNPSSQKASPVNRNDVGATHLGFIVEDAEQLYQELAAKGVTFVSPPVYRKVRHPLPQRVCYLQDPDGNWLELLERPPAPSGAKGS